MIKEAIAVYNPSDPLERAIQDAFHKYNDGWMSAYECKLFAKAVTSLKSYMDEWLENPSLLATRVDYFFAPFMTQRKDTMVFVTHNLFLRDVLENRSINSYIYDPVVFVSTPIAHYLLREYPIHVVVNMDIIKSKNKDIVDMGGLCISEAREVDISDSVQKIFEISQNKKRVQDEIPVKFPSILDQKVASTMISKGVFKIDEHERSLKPDSKVWHKTNRVTGSITLVEPGETGNVHLIYEDGLSEIVSKENFDKHLVVLA